jgi:hyperosmotically inducible periplasmic protein
MNLSVPLITVLALGCVATLSNGCSGSPTKESTGEYMDNSMITSKIKSAYMQDPVVKGGDVSVESFKGTVMLSGFVDTPEQKARAEEIAAKTTGVVAVKNNLTVKHPAGTQATPASTPTSTTTPATTTTTPPVTTDPATTTPNIVTPPPAP